MALYLQFLRTIHNEQIVHFVQKGKMKKKKLSDGRVYFSSNDLAKIFSVNESTIKRWADSGKLRCLRTVGNHRRFPLELVSEFVARYHLEPNMPLEIVKER